MNIESESNNHMYCMADGGRVGRQHHKYEQAHLGPIILIISKS